MVLKDLGVTEIVLPRECRNSILKLVHDIPIMGHSGVEKDERSTSPEILLDMYIAGFC